MKKLLITGFEPFGGETSNPSWEAIKFLPKTINEYELTKLCLPVVFGEAADAARKAAADLRPGVILCIGQAGGRAAITPEMVAINLRHATMPDNNGNQPCDEPVINGGNAAYFSTVPVRRIAEAINLGDLPSQVSYSAGAYVCNDLFYTLLASIDSAKTQVGFIHVPYAKEQNKEPALPLCDIVKGLIAAIESLD